MADSANGEVTYCNARTRDASDDQEKRDPGEWAGEGYCNNPTDSGRCRMHGKNAGRSASHGLYSFRRKQLREKLDAADGMESPGDLWTEVAVLRTLLSEYLEDVEEVDGDVLSDVSKIQKELRRTVDNIHEMLVRTRPTEEEVTRMIDGFAQILNRYVDDGDRADALEELQGLVGHDRPAALQSGDGR